MGGDILPKNPIARFVLNIIGWTWLGYRCLTLPLRYLIWRAKGNGWRKNPDGTKTYRSKDDKPHILL